MYPFQYQRPNSLSQLQHLIREDDNAKLIAGGMTLLPAMKHRLAMPSQLIDIGRMNEFTGISKETNFLTIGAVTKHYEVAANALIKSHIPGLSNLANLIGDAQVRARGTLGGSLANNDPSADYPAAALALNAQIITDQRSISAEEFFQGLYTTCLEPNEIITAVKMMIPQKSVYKKLKQTASGYALVGVFVAAYPENTFHVAVTGVGNGVFRWTQAEIAMQNHHPIPNLHHEQLIEDIHATGRYRAHMTKVLLEEALKSL